MSTRLGVIGLVAAALAILATARPSRGGTLYAITYDWQGTGDTGRLYTVSTTSATASLVATLNNPFNLTQPMGLAFTPEGRLYAYSGQNLIEINRVSGMLQAVDIESLPGTVEGGLAFDVQSGMFYASGAANDAIITIDPATGARAVVGEAGPWGQDISGLTFASDGTLYGVALRGALPDALVTVNTATGLATFVGLTGTNGVRGVAGLAFDPDDGTLYMAVDAGLYRVNRSTGQASIAGFIRPDDAPTTNVGAVSGLAIFSAQVVPAPSVGAGGLLLLAYMIGGRVRRRS